MSRILILMNRWDDTALRVASVLKKRHDTEQVVVVSSEELVLAPHWTHRLQDNGRVTSEVKLTDGTVISSKDTGVVFNRLRSIPMPHFDKSAETDKSYASMEMHALLVSWLSSFSCAVINPATSRGLGGPELSHSEWIMLAGKAGLPVQRTLLSTDPDRHKVKNHVCAGPPPPVGACIEDTLAGAGLAMGYHGLTRLRVLESGARMDVFVTGDEIIGSAGNDLKLGLMKLKTLSKCEILRVAFSETGSEGIWEVSEVDHFFETDDTVVINRIAGLLESRAAL